MKAWEMWNLFTKKGKMEGENYEAWAFGEDPDGLAKLVLLGIKTGTASAWPIYEMKMEPFPREGGYSVILNEDGEAVCVIQTTKVYVVPFDQVTEEHARKEGEGDKSLEYWREIHRNFFTKELKEAGLNFNEEMKVVCEEFEVVYRPD